MPAITFSQKKRSKYEKQSMKLSMLRRLRIMLHRMFICLSIITFFAISFWVYQSVQNGLIAEIRHNILEKFFAVSNKYGMSLENIYLSGQLNTSDEEILETINLTMNHPILDIDLNLIKSKLENLTWVKKVIVEREFPNTLYLKITERKPIALWQYKSKLKLIDEDGEIISTKNIEKFYNMIILVGDDAPANAAPIIDLISNSKLKDFVLSLVYVGQRRWNVRLKNGVEIKLPENNFVNAWLNVIKLYENGDISDNDNIKYIDLRVEDRMYLKRKD